MSLADTGAGLRPAGGEWANAIVNEPVAEGTEIRSGPQGRAEIRLSGITAALAPGTTIDIERLDEGGVRLALRSGHVDLSIDQRGTARLEIDAAKGPIRLDAPGRYGIDADNGLVGKLAAPATSVLPDQMPATLPGAAALAGYGKWDRSDLGAIWYPQHQPADWIPFRDGSWHYLQPWGWVWVDAAPWGFAPSHYGRWARVGERWGWLPGSGDGVSQFLPATVAFLGTPGIGLSYAGGTGPAIAWFPLAPGETYWPPNEGEPPASLINAAYKDRRFATAVPRAVFVGGKPVGDALVDIPNRRLDVAPVIPGSPRVTPPAPKLVAALPPIKPAKPAPPPLAVAAAKPGPARVALDAPAHPRLKHALTLHHPRAPPLHIAVARSHPEHDRKTDRRHIAEAHHILRQ